MGQQSSTKIAEQEKYKLKGVNTRLWFYTIGWGKLLGRHVGGTERKHNDQLFGFVGVGGRYKIKKTRRSSWALCPMHCEGAVNNRSVG